MRKYHGWIYIEKSEHFRDSFYVHATRQNQEPLVNGTGHGALGAAAAVAFFEEPKFRVFGNSSELDGLNLGRVKLEPTPLGLRVYTEENDGETDNTEIK